MGLLPPRDASREKRAGQLTSSSVHSRSGEVDADTLASGPAGSVALVGRSDVPLKKRVDEQGAGGQRACQSRTPPTARSTNNDETHLARVGKTVRDQGGGHRVVLAGFGRGGVEGRVVRVRLGELHVGLDRGAGREEGESREEESRRRHGWRGGEGKRRPATTGRGRGG